MVLNLIITIVATILMAFFVGFNLDNKCDVNLLVHTFKDVHVFITILISFAVGMIGSLPIAFSYRAKKAKQLKEKQENTKQDEKKPAETKSEEKTGSPE